MAKIITGHDWRVICRICGSYHRGELCVAVWGAADDVGDDDGDRREEWGRTDASSSMIGVRVRRRHLTEIKVVSRFRFFSFRNFPLKALYGCCGHPDYVLVPGAGFMKHFTACALLGCRGATIHRCIDISRYFSRDTYRDIIFYNCDFVFLYYLFCYYFYFLLFFLPRFSFRQKR